MARTTQEHIDGQLGGAGLDPGWTEPDRSPAQVPVSGDAFADGPLGPPSAPRHVAARRMGVAALVIAAIVAGSAGTRWFDGRTPAHTPAWTAACQDAINATAELHRVQGVQLQQEMQATFGAVAGIRSRPGTVDTARTARLQRDADNAVARCISPENPPS